MGFLFDVSIISHGIIQFFGAQTHKNVHSGTLFSDVYPGRSIGYVCTVQKRLLWQTLALAARTSRFRSFKATPVLNTVDRSRGLRFSITARRLPQSICSCEPKSVRHAWDRDGGTRNRIRDFPTVATAAATLDHSAKPALPALGVVLTAHWFSAQTDFATPLWAEPIIMRSLALVQVYSKKLRSRPPLTCIV